MNKAFLLLLPLIFLISCSQEQENEISKQNIAQPVMKSPSEVAKEFQLLTSKSDPTALQYLSSKDKPHYQFSTESKYDILNDFISPLVRVEVKSEVITENTAVVELITVAPDFTSLYSELVGLVFDNLGLEEEEYEELFTKKLNELPENWFEDIETISVESSLNLILENEEWKVFQNLELKNKIVALKEKAENLLENDQFDEALIVTNEILEIDPNNDYVDALVVKANTQIQEREEKAKIIQNIQITDWTVTTINTYSEDDVPAIRFGLKNNSDKTLDQVEVTVFFYDKQNNIIFEEDYYPVLVSEYSFGSNNKPLKPNYIWRQEPNKYYTISELKGSEWSGKASAKITDIRIQE